MTKINYEEGSVFIVPLPGDVYGHGVAARVTAEGPVLLGYFFCSSLTRDESKRPATIDALSPSKADLIARCSDLGLIGGQWPIVGRISAWRREHWKMPQFIRKDLLGKLKPVIVTYSDDDPGAVQSEMFIDDPPDLAPDRMSGYKAIETRLHKICARRQRGST